MRTYLLVLKNPVLVYNCRSQKKWRNQRTKIKESLVLCWLFHETCWFFKVFEITRTVMVLWLWIYFKKLELTISWFWNCLKNQNWHRFFKNWEIHPTCYTSTRDMQELIDMAIPFFLFLKLRQLWVIFLKKILCTSSTPCLFFLFSFLASRWTGDQPQGEWAKFGYRSHSNIEMF
jgi:hypothetical protein